MKISLVLFVVLISSQFVWASNQCVELMQKKDYYEASDVCKTLAEEGEVNAQFSMGILYYQGSGLISDMGEAQKWMRKAAEKNHNQAQYNLGIMLANGKGSDVDLIEAYAWLMISKENGYTAAAESVAQLGAELSSNEKKQAKVKMAELKGKLK